MIGKFSIREILEAFLEAGIWSSFPGSSRTIREESHVCKRNVCEKNEEEEKKNNNGRKPIYTYFNIIPWRKDVLKIFLFIISYVHKRMLICFNKICLDEFVRKHAYFLYLRYYVVIHLFIHIIFIFQKYKLWILTRYERHQKFLMGSHNLRL